MDEPRLGKRDRTRRKLIDAGMQVIAARGEALTASDVVAAADVSNGTFYNHFLDRDDFIQTLAHESLEAITERSAEDTVGADPAWRFAVASARVLDAALRQPLWGRAVLRLADCPTPLHAGIQQHLRADLADGHQVGRFAYGDDPVTVDLVSGTLMAAIRRLISNDAQLDDVDPEAIHDVVARLLEAIGVDRDEARSLAVEAHGADLQVSGDQSSPSASSTSTSAGSNDARSSGAMRSKTS